MATDWTLYLVTDPELGGGPERVPEIVDKAVKGGVSVVQLRDKHAPHDVFLERARKLQELLAPTGVPLFVNDRLDIACELGLHLHIGQDDVDYETAREKLPADLMIGLSVGNQEELDAVAALPKDMRPDVIGVGPIEATQTKKDAGVGIGAEKFNDLASQAKKLGVEAVAIGGVKAENAPQLNNGAGICVVSAIMKAADPEQAARALRSAFEQGRK